MLTNQSASRSRKVRNAATCLSSLTTLISTSVLAAGEEGGKLEEVIVTASKRETNLMHTPMAITAFTPALQQWLPHSTWFLLAATAMTDTTSHR